MSKSTITRLFVISVIACITGGVLISIGWFAAPDEGFIRNGTDIVGVRETASAIALLGLGFTGALVLLGAAIAGFSAWIGALLNTATLERKRWFVAIALLQVINCGLLGVLAYVVAGPDGTRRASRGPAFTAASAS